MTLISWWLTQGGRHVFSTETIREVHVSADRREPLGSGRTCCVTWSRCRWSIRGSVSGCQARHVARAAKCSTRSALPSPQPWSKSSTKASFATHAHGANRHPPRRKALRKQYLPIDTVENEPDTQLEGARIWSYRITLAKCSSSVRGNNRGRDRRCRRPPAQIRT